MSPKVVFVDNKGVAILEVFKEARLPPLDETLQCPQQVVDNSQAAMLVWSTRHDRRWTIDSLPPLSIERRPCMGDAAAKGARTLTRSSSRKRWKTSHRTSCTSSFA